jgi:hypothetical protein
MDNGHERTSEVMPYAHLEDLLKQNLEIAKENHKILKRMERNALIGFIARIVVWLIVLGVPLFFLSTYLLPVIETFQHTGTSTPGGLFGIPSAAEFQKAIEEYRGGK